MACPNGCGEKISKKDVSAVHIAVITFTSVISFTLPLKLFYHISIKVGKVCVQLSPQLSPCILRIGLGIGTLTVLARSTMLHVLMTIVS